MERNVEKKVNITNGLIISDPWYEKGVKCRYENKQRMTDYNLHIQTKQDATYKDWFNVAVTILDDTAHEHVKVNDTLDAFTYPRNLKIKETEIGMDTASVLIGSNTVYIEEIHTGTDGYLGMTYQLNRPVKVGDKVKNQYCGVVFFGSFDSTLNTAEEIVRTLVYNFTGSSI